MPPIAVMTSPAETSTSPDTRVTMPVKVRRKGIHFIGITIIFVFPPFVFSWMHCIPSAGVILNPVSEKQINKI